MPTTVIVSEKDVNDRIDEVRNNIERIAEMQYSFETVERLDMPTTLSRETFNSFFNKGEINIDVVRRWLVDSKLFVNRNGLTLTEVMLKNSLHLNDLDSDVEAGAFKINIRQVGRDCRVELLDDQYKLCYFIIDSCLTKEQSSIDAMSKLLHESRTVSEKYLDVLLDINDRFGLGGLYSDVEVTFNNVINVN